MISTNVQFAILYVMWNLDFNQHFVCLFKQVASITKGKVILDQDSIPP
jgi:hypothetical protein